MISGTRILMIGINYAPELTGIGRYSGEMGDWLSKQGASVSVITGFPYYPDWKVRPGYRTGWFYTEKKEGMLMIRCPLYVPQTPTTVRRMLQDLSFFMTSWLAVTGLLLRGSRFDHIWVATPSFLSGWVGRWAGLFSRKARLHLHVFDLPLDAAIALGMIRGHGLLKLLSVLESKMMKGFHRVSTLSDGMRHRIIQKGVSPHSVIELPIWVNTQQFKPGDVDAKQLSDLGLPVGRLIILYSGAVGEKQGLDSVLSMAALAHNAGRKDLCFVIAGDGPYASALQAEAMQTGLDNILFMPLQSDEHFPHLLNAAWLHLILQRDTRSEYFMPSKLCPIFSAGGLALVTATPESSLGKLITNHQVAALSPVNDGPTLYQQLIKLYESPEKCNTLKSNARLFAMERLSKEHLLAAYWNNCS